MKYVQHKTHLNSVHCINDTIHVFDLKHLNAQNEIHVLYKCHLLIAFIVMFQFYTQTHHKSFNTIYMDTFFQVYVIHVHVYTYITIAYKLIKKNMYSTFLNKLLLNRQCFNLQVHVSQKSNNFQRFPDHAIRFYVISVSNNAGIT